MEPAFIADTRAGYDVMAREYAARFADATGVNPWDRAMLTAFAGVVDGPVVDVGCGPGAITALLSDLGVDVFGVDLSPRTVELTRARYPKLRFEVGSMTALDVPDGSLGGVAALYSIIHVPADYVPGVLAEFARVLRPGGHLILAFQVGDETRHRDEAFGHAISVDWHRRQPDAIATLLAAAGFETRVRMVREPQADYESTAQAYMVARRASPS
jgi:SAM-dependent methyltransferase